MEMKVVVQTTIEATWEKYTYVRTCIPLCRIQMMTGGTDEVASVYMHKYVKMNKINPLFSSTNFTES